MVLKNFQPRPRPWRRPRMIKIAFFNFVVQRCVRCLWYSPGEHPGMAFKIFQPRTRPWPRPKMLKNSFFLIQLPSSTI